jgi:hypothetical protein
MLPLRFATQIMVQSQAQSSKRATNPVFGEAANSIHHATHEITFQLEE